MGFKNFVKDMADGIGGVFERLDAKRKRWDVHMVPLFWLKGGVAAASAAAVFSLTPSPIPAPDAAPMAGGRDTYKTAQADVDRMSKLQQDFMLSSVDKAATKQEVDQMKARMKGDMERFYVTTVLDRSLSETQAIDLAQQYDKKVGFGRLFDQANRPVDQTSLAYRDECLVSHQISLGATPYNNARSVGGCMNDLKDATADKAESKKVKLAGGGALGGFLLTSPLIGAGAVLSRRRKEKEKNKPFKN